MKAEDKTQATAADATASTASPAADPKAAGTKPDQITDKKADTKAADKSDTKTEDKPADKTDAPVEYKFTAPEGRKLDEGMVAKLVDYAKANKLPPEQAQKVVDMGLELQTKLVEESIKAFQEQNAQWAEAVKTDALIGGDNSGQKIAIAKQALQVFGDEELNALLRPFHPTENPKGLGLGNHPAIIRWAYRAGRAKASEDVFVPAGARPVSDQDATAKLYPSMAAQK